MSMTVRHGAHASQSKIASRRKTALATWACCYRFVLVGMLLSLGRLLLSLARPEDALHIIGSFMATTFHVPMSIYLSPSLSL